MAVRIRPERPEDAPAIRAVTIAAFESSPYGHNGEADIVDALRVDGALALSLVAEMGGGIVGHVACSPVHIMIGQGDWYGLGPVSVVPGHQGQGIGQVLVRAGLDRLRALDAAGCVVLGEPEYYGRFGFESDPALRYGEAPAAYFQRLLFQGRPPSGEAHYHASFGP
jgi:putative acetyltransferase